MSARRSLIDGVQHLDRETPVDFSNKGLAATSGGLEEASQAAGVGLPELWAVVSVETSGCGQFDAQDPDISQPTPGGYGPSGANQYERLAAAIQLDRNAALQSASWGMGQIMGINFRASGFNTVEDMVAAMVESEDRQLLAGAKFMVANGMGETLRDYNWSGFARRYNGPNYAARNYDGLLRDFYRRYAGGDVPDLRVRAAQIYFTYKGFEAGVVDGVEGRRTTSAVKEFQRSINVDATGTINDT